MSITDELREWWVRKFAVMDRKLHKDFTAIADRIDAEHESACAEAYGNGVESVALPDMTAYVKLPLDANGVPIRVGDWVTGSIGGKAKVVAITEECAYWWEPDGCHWCEGYLLRHYHHAPTVEDVLREMVAAYMDTPLDDSNDGEFFAEYAAKLRLAGGAE